MDRYNNQLTFIAKKILYNPPVGGYYRQVIFPATRRGYFKDTFAFFVRVILGNCCMNKFLFFAFTILVFSSCDLFSKKKTVAGPTDRIDMMNTDRAFSKMSEEKGMKNAFLEYIDSNGVLLKPDRMPIVGADAIDFLIQQNDSSYILKWEPRHGAVAKSGELGYTYGIYALKPAQQDTILYGTYVSIWKKQADGKWKYVLDSGNEGIGDRHEEQ
ncbi:MAG TPA: hypothetical protein VK489_00200 [Ferruginibacter sp.]|nr:hypothetical protein [Ferruginibacter sp.]